MCRPLLGVDTGSGLRFHGFMNDLSVEIAFWFLLSMFFVLLLMSVVR